MRFVHFFSFHFMFCSFHVNMEVSAKPRVTNSPLPVASDHTNIELDVTSTILSTTENQESVIETKVQQSTTETSQIDILSTEVFNHQNATEEPDLVTSEVAFRMGEVFQNPHIESGKAEIEGLSTIVSNVYEEIETVTLKIDHGPTVNPENNSTQLIQHNATEEMQTILEPPKKYVLSPRNANNGGEETEKVLPVQSVDLTLISELLNIPRVMQSASMKLSNLKYVFVYSQEPIQNNSLSKVSVMKREVRPRLNSLNDVDTDL